MSHKVARIAVSAATYWIDKPYDYLIPDDMVGSVCVGTRVFVPFSRGNKRSEGIVLSLAESESTDKLKSIEKVLDAVPVLTEEQIKMALFMRERFFCTIYDAIRAMLPSGLWFKSSGKRNVNDKIVKIACLNITPEEARQISQDKLKKSPKQSKILFELSYFTELPVNDLLGYVQAGKPSFNSLVDEGYISVIEREFFRRPEITVRERQPLPVLNDEQKKVYEQINNKIEENKYSVSLLQGVTGSGKTSVYISLIAKVLSSGKCAILLVPEISLTPQMIHTFSTYFGDDIAVLHSSLSSSERYDEWKRVKKGKAHLVIGTRSAIFAPCDNLGIIIIDEQQEETYKSDCSPRYNAEDIAHYRCYKSGCPLLLGSATPDICTRYKAEIGKYSFFRLDKRFNEKALPGVRIVDLKNEIKNGNSDIISSVLEDELKKNIENGEQSILFLNRRGMHKLISCPVCGYTYKCPHCSVSLTFHSDRKKLMCHYCGYTKKLDKACPECGGELISSGAGTQFVEEKLKELFPDSEIMRVDTDVLNASITHEKVFEKFAENNIPIMIGTQMVTKGLNFDNVTLVGVLNADQSLYASDFRAGERTFSLITQVIGRSGRGAKPGRAVVQTFTPNNETIMQACRQDYDSFYESEIQMRMIQNSPPFCNYLSVTVYGKDENNVVGAARYAKQLIEISTTECGQIEILGPAPLSVVKVNNVYRYRIIIKCTLDNRLRNIISNAVIMCNKDKKLKGVSLYADNDPND